MASPYACVGAWSYMFRRTFWADHRFQFVKGIVYEDTECIPRTFYWARRIASLTKFSVYNYIQREGSTMHKKKDWRALRSLATIVKSTNDYARDVVGNDPFFRATYYANGTGAYLAGLKAMASDPELRAHLADYVRLVRAGGGAKVTATHPVKRFYQWLAIHCPRLFVKMA